ncbi:MAG: beta-propeller fold lactonase family protein [Vicinamibacterales bacterium]
MKLFPAVPAIALTLLAATAHAQPSKSTAVVYVETNSPTANAVLAYERNEKGRLTLVGNYPTGGTGVFDASLQLGPFDSDQDIITNPEHTRLFAVNSGSNTIAVFDIGAAGVLTPIPGSPFPSGGSNPVSLGLARDVLVVVNKGMDPAQPIGGANYAAFRVNPEGRLTALLSAMPIEGEISASQALISPGKRLVFGADFLGGLLRSFLVQPGGELTQTGLVAPPASEAIGTTPVLPLGLITHPKAPVLYVGFVTVGKIGVYTFDSRGVLTFVRAVGDSGAAPCWLRTNDTGTRLYVSNTGDNSISVYDTTSPLEPVEIQHLVLKGEGSSFQVDLDPTGQFLYVVTQRASPATPLGEGNTLHVLDVNENTGRLSEKGKSVYDLPVSPVGTRPKGVASVLVR